MEIVRDVFPVISRCSPWFLVPRAVRKRKIRATRKMDRQEDIVVIIIQQNCKGIVCGKCSEGISDINVVCIPSAYLHQVRARTLRSHSRPSNLAQSKKHETIRRKKRKKNLSKVKKMRREKKNVIHEDCCHVKKSKSY